MLAFGHDLFFTRQSPSKSFDVLSPAFNKSQLVITVTILSVALAVTRSMVRFCPSTDIREHNADFWLCRFNREIGRAHV